MRENADQNNSGYGHFLRSGIFPCEIDFRIFFDSVLTGKYGPEKTCILAYFTQCILYHNLAIKV